MNNSWYIKEYRRRGGRALDYDEEELVSCKICGKKYAFLEPHVRSAHNCEWAEYLQEFDLPQGSAIKSAELKKARGKGKKYLDLDMINKLKKEFEKR